MNRWIYLHPLLAAAAPILFLVAHNPHEAGFSVVAGALIAVIITSILAFALARLIIGDLGRASILAFLAMVWFHGYGRLFEFSFGLEWFGKDIFSSSNVLHLVLALLCVLSLGFAAFRLRRSTANVAAPARLLSTFTGLMALFSLANIGLATAQAPKLAAAPLETRPPFLTEESIETPDVYYIVLDGYARQDVLKKFYRFDNSAFIASLRARGFFVANNSRSAYPETFLSLTSTLEMRYLDDFKNDTAEEMDLRRDIYKLLHQHLVGRTFQKHGYRYVHFNTNFSATDSMDLADIAYSYRPPQLQSEFVSVLLRTTMLRPLEPDVASMYLYMLDKIKEVPTIQGPTFTFLHLLMPHNPYVFDRHGNIRKNVPLTLQMQEKTGGWRAKKDYIEQLRYVNGRVLEVVDALVAKSKVPPVIILQSDHGSASSYRTRDSAGQRAKTWHERTGTLNAWYAPPAVKEKLSDNMVSVNTFRTLFSTLFGENLPDLPRKISFSWYSFPYRFLDITEEVEYAFSDKTGLWDPNRGLGKSWANDTAAPMYSSPDDTGPGQSASKGRPR